MLGFTGKRTSQIKAKKIFKKKTTTEGNKSYKLKKNKKFEKKPRDINK